MVFGPKAATTAWLWGEEKKNKTKQNKNTVKLILEPQVWWVEKQGERTRDRRWTRTQHED